MLPNLSVPDVPFPAILSTHQETASGQACNPPDPPIDIFCGGGNLWYRYQSGSFPLINAGSGFSLPA